MRTPNLLKRDISVASISIGRENVIRFTGKSEREIDDLLYEIDDTIDRYRADVDVTDDRKIIVTLNDRGRYVFRHNGSYIGYRVSLNPTLINEHDLQIGCYACTIDSYEERIVIDLERRCKDVESRRLGLRKAEQSK